MVAGVCAGLAEYFDIDPTVIRVIWVLSVFAGIGIIAYIVCWLVMPEKRYDGSLSNTSYPDTPQQTSTVDKEKNKQVLGISLIIMGVLFMFDKFFNWFDMDLLIPLAIIAVGGYIIFSNTRRGS
jgi:phage shock protein PspC (stress-responsive transcriptional regulator)